MENSQKNSIKHDKIEEMSAAAAVTGAPVATKSSEEDKLRKMIRKSITLYSITKNKTKKENVQEQKLRKIIRNLIKERLEEQEEEVSGNTTWKNVLGDLLNYMIPLMREKYTQLQTNMTERQGFKEFVQTYFNSQFEQIDNADELAKQKELEEQENTPKIIRIKDGVKSRNPDFFDDVDDKSQKNKSVKKKEEPETKRDAQTYEEIGQNFAEEFVNSIGDRVKDDYSKKLPAQDNSREEFKRVFFANIESWYEIWDENEPVSQQDQPTEPEQEEPDSPEAGDLVPGEEVVSGDDQPEAETDLFELLDSDLE